VCEELALLLLIDCGFLLAACRAPGPWHASHCNPPGPNGARLSMRCPCLPLKMAAPEEPGVTSSVHSRQVSAPFSLYCSRGGSGGLALAGALAAASAGADA